MTTAQKAKKITKAPSMRETLDRAPFSTLENLLAKVAADFVPNERLSVTESATKYTMIGDGGGRTVHWSLRKTPYIAEPQDTLMVRVKNALVEAPKQFATASMGHTIMDEISDAKLDGYDEGGND